MVHHTKLMKDDYKTLIRLLFDICLLKKGPQDLNLTEGIKKRCLYLLPVGRYGLVIDRWSTWWGHYQGFYWSLDVNVFYVFLVGILFISKAFWAINDGYFWYGCTPVGNQSTVYVDAERLTWETVCGWFSGVGRFFTGVLELCGNGTHYTWGDTNEPHVKPTANVLLSVSFVPIHQPDLPVGCLVI